MMDLYMTPRDSGSVFWEDMYLYDLNRMQSGPLAYRCAKGGVQPPALTELLGISVREWTRVEDMLYSMPLCLECGALILPVFGSIGRLALVLNPAISKQAFSCLAQREYLGKVYVQESLLAEKPAIPAKEREAAEGFAQTVTRLRLLMECCDHVSNIYEAEECIGLASALFGVSLMQPEASEMPAMKGQVLLPDAQPSGQAMLVGMMTLLSFMRNHAHVRSGWLYAMQSDAGVLLQAAMRCAADAPTHALTHLKELLENGGVVLGERTYTSPIKPPRQYAYMNRKITDPRHPFCALCGCLDERCATCVAVQWAILPCVCDAALLGIKNGLTFSE